MDKPEWRDSDASPNRADDVKFKIEKLGVDFEASGRMVIAFLLTAALIGLGVFHDWKDGRDHDRMIEAQILAAGLQATSICVLSLNEEERREFRIEGKYCHDSLREVREYLKRRDALPEKSGDIGAAYAAQPFDVRFLAMKPETRRQIRLAP